MYSVLLLAHSLISNLLFCLVTVYFPGEVATFNNSQPLESKTEQASEVIMEDVVVVEPNQMATLEIKGMECDL